jgi:plasmid stabilization system protein ParE
MKGKTALILGIIALACACGPRDEGSKEGADKDGTVKAEAAAPDKAPGEAKPAGSVGTEGPRLVPLGREKLSASHILLMHQGSERKPPEITRTKEEAETLARELYAKIKGGADLAELARQHSDCPSGKEKGGDLGVFPANRMVPEFSRAVLAMEVGQVSEPVESPFGYHIIKRQEVDEVHARHILVMHAESQRKPPEITRTKEEAKKLIEEIEQKLKGGADFAELAKEHSDCPSGKRGGGDLGSFGRGRMAKPFEEAAWALRPDEVSGIVETDFGYHVIQRLP